MSIIDQADIERKRYLEEGDGAAESVPLNHPSLTPIGHRVLVRRDKAKERVGLIWIPDDDQVEGQFATVLALGAGNDFDGKPVVGRFNVAVGQRVCLYKHGGTHVKRGDAPSIKDVGAGLQIVEHADILGIVEEV